MGKVRVAIVAPSLGILGGQAVQADRLLRQWRDDPAVDAWLVPINPVPPGPLRYATRVKYLRTVVTELTYLPLLARELRRADVVHIFSASFASFLIAPLPAIIVAKALGKPIVLNYHSGEAPDHLRGSAIARAALARVDCNVVQSQFLHDVFASFGLDSVIVPNTIDFNQFRFRTRTRFGPHLVSTRNLESNYNVSCTIRAFRIVQDRCPAATLTVVGYGSEQDALARLARELKLLGVTFVGRVPPGDVQRYYDAADVFVQTPNVDNMPLSVLEAFAMGLPVVSTEAGGISAILRHEVDGLLAPVNDHCAIAAQILRVLEDPALARRLVRSAHASCQAFGWSAVREKWLEVYRDAIGSATADTARPNRSDAVHRAPARRPVPSAAPDRRETRPELVR